MCINYVFVDECEEDMTPTCCIISFSFLWFAEKINKYVKYIFISVLNALILRLGVECRKSFSHQRATEMLQRHLERGPKIHLFI